MKKALIAALLCWIFCWTLPLLAQVDTGELHIAITDTSGLGVKSSVELSSEATQYSNTLETDAQGHLDVKRLPFGIYDLKVTASGFATLTQKVEVRSSIPAELKFSLKPATVTTSVTVTEAATLINPHQATTVNELGQKNISERPAALPGRSLQNLVNSQPGWLFEGSGVLHPRGVEYQTQFVVDGIPLTDNRSPGFAPEITSADVEDLKVYTAGIPAEYGRKMGGVIQIDTLGETEPGLHGKTVLAGGSYHTASAYTELQYGWKHNTIGFSGNGSRTDHYLNPVVPENYTNRGTTAGWTASYERDLTPNDRLTFTVRHGLSRFQIPNELVQQQAGQRVDADNLETMGTAIYQHIFSPNVVGWLRGMVRKDQNDLTSNPLSTPVIAFQHNQFSEGYFSGSLAVHSGHNDWKAGIESDNTFLNENFVSPTLSFAFSGNRPQLEQAAYLQDTIRLGRWTVDAGLRWDHYQLLVNQNAVSPRFSVSRYFAGPGVVLHFSYDRVFQTPSFTNILLSSSQEAAALNPNYLPGQPYPVVKPSHGNYYEAGVTKGFARKVRVDVNYFLRRMNNFPDDDNLLNTSVAFPTTWDHAVIYGVEAKVEVPKWGRFSGWASYSYQVGMNWLPIVGGFLLQQQDVNSLPTTKFPVTQDQRNTLRARVRYQATSRLWFALGTQFNSGLPFEYDGTQADAINTYGAALVSHLNFSRGRIDPIFMQNASVGLNVFRQGERSVRLQADCTNLSNVMDVLDFGGLFSGNAIGPKRSYTFRLVGRF